MEDLTRRDAMKAIATVGAGLLLTPQKLFAAEVEKEEGSALVRAFADSLMPKPLPFKAGSLKGISERLIQSHWENNYCGAVKALNTTKKRLSEALSNTDLPPYIYADMKREHLVRSGSVVLHEIYFANLGGDGKAGDNIESEIKDAFGSLERWESEFKKIGAGLSGGSGWVILGYNFHLKQLENYWSWDHMHNAPATAPIIVMDMYEHAYQMDYGAAAAKYIDAFFQNINWHVANERLMHAKQMKFS